MTSVCTTFRHPEPSVQKGRHSQGSAPVREKKTADRTDAKVETFIANAHPPADSEGRDKKALAL